MNYKKMVEDINKLAETDFNENMELKSLPGSDPYTQDEAHVMSNTLSRIYLISHQIHCKAHKTYEN
jgi:hypothetical protein